MRDDDGVPVAVVPGWAFGVATKKWPEAPDVVLMRGKVDVKGEYVALRSGERELARLAPVNPECEEAGLYWLEWLIPRDHPKAEKWTRMVTVQIDLMFAGKLEACPWGYLLYHCGTTSNTYACMSDNEQGVYFAW